MAKKYWTYMQRYFKNKLTEEKVNKNEKKNDGYFKWKLFEYQ